MHIQQAVFYTIRYKILEHNHWFKIHQLTYKISHLISLPQYLQTKITQNYPEFMTVCVFNVNKSLPNHIIQVTLIKPIQSNYYRYNNQSIQQETVLDQVNQQIMQSISSRNKGDLNSKLISLSEHQKLQQSFRNRKSINQSIQSVGYAG